MAWRQTLRRLRRAVSMEAERRRSLAELEAEAGRIMAAMVLRTIGGDGGPFAGMSIDDAAEAFVDRPAIAVGVERLEALRRKTARKTSHRKRAGRNRQKGR